MVAADGTFILFQGAGLGEATTTAASYSGGAEQYGFTRGYVTGQIPTYDHCTGMYCYVPWHIVVDTGSREVLAIQPDYGSIAGIVAGAGE